MEVFPEWLPLTDYSTKYKVSVSTLRRKIKADDINFRFEDGKYLIQNCPPEAHPQHRPSQMSEVGAGVGSHTVTDSAFKTSGMAPSGASRASYFGPSSTTLEIEQRIQKARADLQAQAQVHIQVQPNNRPLNYKASQTELGGQTQTQNQTQLPKLDTAAFAQAKVDVAMKTDDQKADTKNDESVLAAANRLLNELKRAYTQILHEREEQIMQLKEEAADLKTLVRVLESENDRLRGFKQ